MSGSNGIFKGVFDAVLNSSTWIAGIGISPNTDALSQALRLKHFVFIRHVLRRSTRRYRYVLKHSIFIPIGWSLKHML